MKNNSIVAIASILFYGQELDFKINLEKINKNQKLMIANLKNLKKLKSANYEEEKDFIRDPLRTHEWIRKNFINWEKDLTANEKKSISDYTGGSRDFNTFLRTGLINETNKNGEKISELDKNLMKEYFNEKKKNIDSALSKAKLEKTIYLYRRVNETQFFSSTAKEKIRAENDDLNDEVIKKINDNFIKNQYEYQDNGFVSTSISPNPPEGQVNDNFSHFPILLKIKVPKGTNGAFLSQETSITPTDLEVLIARNYSFKYKNSSTIFLKGSKVFKIDMELLAKK